MKGLIHLRRLKPYGQVGVWLVVIALSVELTLQAFGSNAGSVMGAQGRDRDGLPRRTAAFASRKLCRSIRKIG